VESKSTTDLLMEGVSISIFRMRPVTSFGFFKPLPLSSQISRKNAIPKTKLLSVLRTIRIAFSLEAGGSTLRKVIYAACDHYVC